MSTGKRTSRNVTVAVALSALVLAAGCDIDVSDRASSPTTSPEGTPGTPGEPSPAEQATNPDGDLAALLLIMDASGSMNDSGPGGQTLLAGAKQALHGVVDALPDDQHVGLRVYGHRFSNTDRENGCQDTELIHPVSPLDRPALRESIDRYDAVGYTPIGRSLQEAADDLPAEGPRTIILVSDGEDTCAPPEPCDVAADIAADGIDLVIHTVGFALGGDEPARSELQCIADEGGGDYRDAEDSGELAEAINEATRDRRQFEVAGDVLEGAPIPRDARTGQVDTLYTDTVLGGETNFYRFEIAPGTEVQGELIVAGVPDAHDLEHLDGRFSCPHLSLRSIRDQYYGNRLGKSDGDRSENTKILHTDPTVVEADEVFLRVRMDGFACQVWEGPDLELEIEIRLTVVVG